MIGGMSDLTIPEEDVPPHDPMCPFAQWPDEDCYQRDAGVNICALIAQVREDERVKSTPVRWVQQAVVAAKEARNAALRDAVEAVKVLPSAWTDAAYREKALAAIEALGGER